MITRPHPCGLPGAPLSGSLAQACTGGRQERAHVQDRETEAYGGAVTCPGTHSEIQVEAAWYQAPRVQSWALCFWPSPLSPLGTYPCLKVLISTNLLTFLVSLSGLMSPPLISSSHLLWFVRSFSLEFCSSLYP